jgi:hypothetical protein
MTSCQSIFEKAQKAEKAQQQVELLAVAKVVLSLEQVGWNHQEMGPWPKRELTLAL